jgi:hypothetical protein
MPMRTVFITCAIAAAVIDLLVGPASARIGDGPASRFYTMVCMSEVPLGTENAEADKKENARCTDVCGGTRENCETFAKIASNHRLRATKCWRIQQ